MVSRAAVVNYYNKTLIKVAKIRANPEYVTYSTPRYI
jgi:hypothetical protein